MQKLLSHKCFFNFLTNYMRRVSTNSNEVAVEVFKHSDGFKIIDNKEILDKNELELRLGKQAALDDCKEDLNLIEPDSTLKTNLASHVNNSKPLQSLLSLGVKLYVVEKRLKNLEFVLQDKFENHLKNLLQFFNILGIKNDEIGDIISKSPTILKENIDNLEVRIEYLRSKLFAEKDICRIISKNPYWLTFHIRNLDNRLGFFQKQFLLTGSEVRHLATKQPKLITYELGHIKKIFFIIKEEMGFMNEEIKTILLKQPNIFMKGSSNMTDVFEYLHNQMKIPLERIADNPKVLTCRFFKLKQRHLFLESLGRAQYSFRESNYVSLTSLIEGSDVEFCENVAKSSIQSFNTFLKTQ